MATRGTRPLVESALLAALGAVLMLLGWYVPVIGTIASMVSPLPAAMAVIRHGARWGVMSSLVTMFVIAPLVGIPNAVALWAINGAMGISFGVAVRRNLRPTLVLTVAAVGSVVALVIEYAAAYLLMGLTLTKQLGEIITILRESLEQTQKLLGSNPAVDELLKNLPTVDLMIMLVPALLILTAFMLAYLNFEIFRRILPRLGYTLDPLPPFSRWIFPEIIAHAGLIAFLANMFQASINLPIVQVVAQNVFIVASMVFMVEALSALAFYLLRSGMSRGMTAFFAIMAISLMMQPGPLSLLATIFGMIDILFDFRRIRSESLDEI